jgi:DNA-binding transcriptional ArsR family regulator
MLHHQHGADLVFRALADPTRRRIVERLGKGPLAASELAEPLDMTLSAVMQHLGVLEECGLIRTRKEGRRRICALDSPGISTLEDWIAHRRAEWDRRFDRLGDVIARNRKPKGRKP